MSYYGWKNKETWLVALYFNRVDWQNFVETELLRGEEDEEITEGMKVEMLAEYLKDYIEEEVAATAGLSDFLNDLLTNAISEIDFIELATEFLYI